MKELSEPEKGNIVKIKKFNKSLSRWPQKAVVLKEISPHSYLVRTENGNELRRNRRHLLLFEENDLMRNADNALSVPPSPRIIADQVPDILPVIPYHAVLEPTHNAGTEPQFTAETHSSRITSMRQGRKPTRLIKNC